MSDIGNRKEDHINICISEDITPGYCYWDDIKLVHEALPELDMDDIDTSVRVFGRRLEFPFIVTAITGGFPGAVKINGNIAEACSRLGIGMGVGSQRAAIEGGERESFEVVKDHDVPLVIANIGAPQLIVQNDKGAFTDEMVEEAMDMVGADALAIHLNFLQEVVQPEGDTRGSGCLERIRDLSRGRRVIAKETGAGISRGTAERLKWAGVAGLDIAGMGGTSFSAVELHRARSSGDRARESIGSSFFDWGIPAPVSVAWADVGLQMVASGGIRSGLHVAKALSMGATCAGAANLVLREAMQSADAVEERLLDLLHELRAAMMLTGARNMEQMTSIEKIITGKCKEWI